MLDNNIAQIRTVDFTRTVLCLLVFMATLSFFFYVLYPFNKEPTKLHPSFSVEMMDKICCDCDYIMNLL